MGPRLAPPIAGSTRWEEDVGEGDVDPEGASKIQLVARKMGCQDILIDSPLICFPSSTRISQDNLAVDAPCVGDAGDAAPSLRSGVSARA